MLTLGVDEVGRGSWAGPIVVGAVILSNPIIGLKDSKLLTRSQRESLYDQIIKNCQEYSLGWVWPREIDKFGLTKSTRLGIKRAIRQIKTNYDQIIIDGNYNYLKTNKKVSVLIKADNLIPSVSAASIMAKVTRDRYMIDRARTFKPYGFEHHVGYGTLKHRTALKKFGICELHRLSYTPIAELISAV